MPITYNIEEDVRFQHGIEKGIEKGVEKGAAPFVINLLKSGIYTPEQIAALGNVSLEFVLKLLENQTETKKKSPVARSKRAKRNGKKA